MALVLGGCTQKEAAPPASESPAKPSEPPASRAATARPAPAAAPSTGMSERAEKAAASATTAGGEPHETAGSPPNAATMTKGPNQTAEKPTEAKAQSTEAQSTKAQSPQSFVGPVARTESYATWLEGRGPYRVDETGAIQAVIAATQPYKCNTEYPYKFSLNEPPPGMSYPAREVKGAQISKHRAVVTIPIRPTKKGSFAVTGTLRFSVCTNDRCLVEKRDLTLQLSAE